VTVYYFDSSAIVKRYIAEVGTDWVIATADLSAGNDILVSLLARVEVPAAVFKRQREGSITVADGALAVADFISDFYTQYQPIGVTLQLAEQAASLAEKHGLRGYDAVQLATALEAGAVRDSLGLSRLIFVSADGALNKASRTESVVTDNPNYHP
jgi:predicted nucleic acid-binding protein